MNHGTKLFRIFGIEISIHFSWWFVFIFLSWSLATAFFPQFFPGYSSTTYWFLGILAALFLFICVLLHELSHSLVAKARNIKVERITLFFFGGVASINDDNLPPLSEFLMAIAGPLFSILLAIFFYLIHQFAPASLFTPISFYLYQVNGALAIFNLLPGFPLDGGRAFRAILYAYYKDLKKATRIASVGGKFFASMLIVLGFISLFNNGGGLWFILLGGFLYYLAGVSYDQVILRTTLLKISLSQIIVKPITLKPSLTFAQLAQKYSSSEHDIFVIQDSQFRGILDLKLLHPISPELQKTMTLKQIAIPLDRLRSVHKKDTAYTAFQRFSEQNINLLPVKDGEKIIGFASRRLLFHRLEWETKFGQLKDIERLK